MALNSDAELALTTDGSGIWWNVCFWDVSTGTIVKTYKGGGVSAPHGIGMVSSQFLLSAQNDKPLLHVWSIQSKDQMQMRMVTPGRVTALAVTPDGLYCIAGIGQKLHIWQVSDGNLLEVITRHYQTITCIKTTDDGSYFVSAGEDNLVLAWSLARILSDDISIISGTKATVEPLHMWTQHSLAVTDVHIGYGGPRARVATCSADQTCKLYDLLSGHLLLSVIFEVGLTSVSMDPAETSLFIGGNNGIIFQVNLSRPPRGLELPFGSDDDPQVFEGHRHKVTSLSVSSDGSHLLSGSGDNTARIWHIPSRQCVRTLNHKGPVTNAAYIPAYENIFAYETTKATMSISTFQRGVRKGCDEIPMYITHSNDAMEDEKPKHSKQYNMEQLEHLEQIPSSEEKLKVDWKKEASKLRAINRELYNFAVQHCTGDLE